MIHRIKALPLLWWIFSGALIVLLGWLSTRTSPILLFGGLGCVLIGMLIINNPWHGMLLFIFFLPFERIGSYDFAGSTIRPSQIIALCIMISLVVNGLGTRRFRLPKNPIVWPIIIFLFVNVCGLFNAPNLDRSVLVFCFTIFTIAIGLMIPFLVQNTTQLQQLLTWYFISLFLVCVFGLYQFVGDLIGLPTALTGLRELYTKEVLGFPRVQSTALEPLYFANYLLAPLSIVISLFIAQVKKCTPLQLLVIAGIGVLNLLLTVARGGYIAFGISIGLILCYYFFQRQLLSMRTITSALVAFVFGVIIVFRFIGIDTLSENFLGHVTNIFSGASYSERVEMFEVALVAFHTHPIIGIGPGSFGPYESGHPYIIPDQGWHIVNNEYLELLAETGVLGFGSMILVFLIVLVRSLKAIQRAQDAFVRAVLVGATTAFVAILVQYNTFSILYIVHVWFTIGLLIALQNMVLLKRHSL
ncbi:MAG: O-antigen ligase family protein [Candidatus Kerfeldbacteria bacterium]|nr:O-antigen ligase family protein [Candidatus Kerfeldbacteria bacterium]